MKQYFVVLFTFVVALVGCSSEKTVPPRPSDHLVIGVDPDRHPFAWPTPFGGGVNGFDVDLFGTICEACRWQAEFRPLATDSLEQALVNGSIDLAVGELNPISSDDRIIFSDPYYLSGLVMVVAPGRPLPENGSSWQGMMVAVPRDVPGNALAFALKDAQVQAYANPDSAAAKVSAGEIAALVVDYTTARCIVAERSELQIVPGWLTTTYFTAAMRAADTVRMTRLNDALAALLGGYTYEQLHMKWFGYPLLNVSVPDSVAARWVKP